MSSKRKSNECLHCDRPAHCRGLCAVCYELARREVAAGQSTWEDLEKKGYVKPPASRVTNPLAKKLQRMTRGR